MGVIVALLAVVFGAGAVQAPAAGLPPTGDAVAAAEGAAPGAVPGTGRRAGTWELGVVFLGCSVLAGLWWADVLRPGSFVRRGGREVGDLPWGVWVLSGLGVFIAGVLGASVVMGATVGLRGAGGDPDLADQALIGIGAAVGSGAAGAAALLLLAPAAPASAGLRVRWWDIPIGVAAFLIVAPVLLAASVMTPILYDAIMGQPPDSIGHETLRVIIDNPEDPWVWGLIAAAVLGAPVAEELIYRVFLQSGMLRLTGSHWWAIGITSVLFTLVHAGSVPVYAMPVLFLLGGAMGLAYERTARLGVPIVMHVAFNAANVGLTLLAAPIAE